MPYIKKIELKNFKSFGPKTASILLDKGFTALTGPNGSGKTNIVDSILFGLGELSARRLRAENLAKLIFHGSPDERVEKARAARIVIQFDNHDSCIPVETSTVTISRQVQKDGQSVYRLNGRRISRTRVLDIMSMAGISSTGHNIVLQGTITRMAEITPQGRRKMIADLVGIAQYDTEKAEAEEKLRAAEISIRTAIGRIDEVQKRVDDLERQRNDLLRYNFIQDEIKQCEALKISHKILDNERRIDETRLRIESLQDKVNRFRQLKEELRTQRHGIETEWKKFNLDVVEEGGAQLLEVQIKIGETRSKLVELKTKLNSEIASLDVLQKVRQNNIQQLETVTQEINNNRKDTRRVKREINRLSEEIELKQSNYTIISNEAAQLRANLGENNKSVQDIQRRLDEQLQNLLALKGDKAQSQIMIRGLTRRLKDLQNRKTRLESSVNALKKSYTDLKTVYREQKNQLRRLEQTITRKINQKESVKREIVQANIIAKSAREAVVEFATQRELAEKIAIEERALRNIEELVELGVITNVYGRLRDLIKIQKGYKLAVEATAAGWLDSMVVRDFNTAFTCAETLKRLKLGRIKIIPLEELAAIKTINPPKLAQMDGPVSAFVRCAKRYEPAVTFVFGDTLVTGDEKTAFNASRSGHRTVTIRGDLYDAGGGIESGYYRAPINFSSIIPSEAAVTNLDEAVNALQKHLTKRGSDIDLFDKEIETARNEITKLTNTISTLEDETQRLRKSIKRNRKNIQRLERHIHKLVENIEEEKTQSTLQKGKQKVLEKTIQKLRTELAELRRKIDPFVIQEMEIKREKLADEIVNLRQSLGEKEAERSTLQSKFKTVLKSGADNYRIPLRKLKWQIAQVEKEIREAQRGKETLENELVDLEKNKSALSHQVFNAKEESKRFTSRIDTIDKKLYKLDKEYETSDRLFNESHLNLQTFQLQLDQDYRRLGELGFQRAVEVSMEKLEVNESSLNLLHLELERLGAINQLAVTQYIEQAKRYKELSLRMNELEQEKLAILAFMDEVEQKKRRIFMEAFNRIQVNLKKYFAKLTDGGEITLKLEKPEEPFAGGIDMNVQFPGKPPILVSGASSGERSVTAVAFIFAIQDFMPASFYLFDEVDAHLDAFHVSKLGELLAEESTKSQFLVLTLKPEMVSKAEKVYGVYERNGISHVVSAVFKGAA